MFIIKMACKNDLKEILELQYESYQSEAIILNNFDIPPLKQNIGELLEEFSKCIILKLTNSNGEICGSVRANIKDETMYIGKLFVHPKYRGRGLGKELLKEIESLNKYDRYELFTSIKSKKNLTLYIKCGYNIFNTKKIDDELVMVYLEKYKK